MTMKNSICSRRLFSSLYHIFIHTKQQNGLHNEAQIDPKVQHPKL